jgi:hypothetical protein
MTLKQRIQDDMKAAMRAKDAARLGTVRLLIAAFRQREIDERMDLDDAGVIAVIDRMNKQRRDSVAQYEAAGREDLAAVERAELAVLAEYLPQALTDAEVDAEIAAAIDAVRTAGNGVIQPADMGKVMAVLKPRLAGRTDIARASARVKAQLSAGH